MKGHLAVALLVAFLTGTAALADPDLPRIRKLRVEHLPIFGDHERLDDVPGLPDLTFIFEAANFLHTDTKHAVILREMLVEEGDPADPRLLAESERNLRDLDFVRQARVFTEPVAPGEVDVVIHVQDTWTTEPRLSFSIGGGSRTSEFGIVEKNLFGRGKRVVLRRREELDRTSNQALYDDPRVWGSRWRMVGNYEDTSDGVVRQGLVERPFYSLETPFAGGARISDLREENQIFLPRGGGERSRFLRDQQLVEARIGALLPDGDPELVQRLGVFYRRIDDDFDQGRGRDPEFIPRDRLESQPGLYYQRQVVRFVRERHLNRFDRIEDLNLGNVLDVDLGFSARGLGASEDEPILTASDRQGIDFGPGRKVFLFSLVTGRFADGTLRNAILDLEVIAYHRVRLFFEQTFVLRTKLDLGLRLDRDVQLFLGSDNGLRGFDTRDFAGARRFVFNLEDRVFFFNDLFHLVSLGAVVFFDSGSTWRPGQAVSIRNLASSVGIGLRIGAPRAAEEKIWRFDLAIPLSNSGDRFMPQFSLGSRQAFVPFVGPLDLQSSGGS